MINSRVVPPRSRPASAPAELRRLVQAFVRDFGFLAQDATPCGKPLANSHAHALMVLLDGTRSLSLSQKDLADQLGLDKERPRPRRPRIGRLNSLGFRF
jgi:hypothetical protein